MSVPFQYAHDDDGGLLRIAARGQEVLTNPLANRGTAFTIEQRKALGLTGLLPSGVMTITDQLKRVYAQYSAQPDDLAKYLYLNHMHDRNEVLYFRLLAEHIEEMLPIVYTPTIGKAIEEYSHWYDRPRGIYLSIDDPEDMEQALAQLGHGPDGVDLIVATDAEGILGIGDQGVGGVAITVGKLAVYTAAAGIHPHRVLPVILDVGTDNMERLNDDGYLGVRHPRVRGERYDEFVQQYVETAHRMFPHALLHWEDFAAGNATRILNKYRDDYCTFNDDIQGTAAVVVAAVLSAVKSSGIPLNDHRIVIHGAGSAGTGIANLLVQLMVSQGADEKTARSHFWGLGSHGLLREGLRLRDFQQPFARGKEELEGWTLDSPDQYTLGDVVRNVHPTILIGCSAQPGAFTEDIVKTMAAQCERPVIMPLSNPTRKAEALPSDVLTWTDGRALVATGSPFKPVMVNGVTYQIAQANNALVFPGIGLGTIAVRASRVTSGMIAAAAEAVAMHIDNRVVGASLLPSIKSLRPLSASVAIAVAQQAMEEGVATEVTDNPVEKVFSAMWQPRYPRIAVV